MDETHTTDSASSASSSGAPPCPEGEETAGHDRSHASVEESPAVLTDNASSEATSTAPARAGSEGAELGEPVVIVRATARLKLDPKLIEPIGRSFDDDKATWKALKDELYQAQRAVAFGQNAVIRTLWRDDGERLDAFVAEHGRMPKNKKEWPDAKANVYKVVRSVVPQIPGAMASVASRTAWQKWTSIRYDALVRQTCSPPHYRDTCPVPLRAADVKIHEVAVGTNGKARYDYLIEFALVAGHKKRWRVRIRPRDGYQRRVLAAIARGDWKHGNVLVERDRKNRWHFRIAYKRLVAPTKMGKTAAVNRGIRVFLACVTDTDDRWLYDGNDIIAYLKRTQMRRRQFQRDAKAAGRAGRGKKRILRPIEHLSGKAARWRATKCQTIARRLTKWLVDRGVKTLLIEDFERIRDTDLDDPYITQLIQEWPYYQLEQRLRSCCAEEGIEVITLAPQYISQVCPKCGTHSEKNRDMRHWQLRCQNPSCNYRQHLDAAAAKNLLGRERGELPEPEPPKSARRKSRRKRR